MQEILQAFIEKCLAMYTMYIKLYFQYVSINTYTLAAQVKLKVMHQLLN